MKESQLAVKVVGAIRERGHYAVKLGGGPYQTPGLPDVLAVVNGRAVMVELKVGSNKPTPLQALTLERLKAAGAVAGVAYTLAEALAMVETAEGLGITPRLRR